MYLRTCTFCVIVSRYLISRRPKLMLLICFLGQVTDPTRPVSVRSAALPSQNVETCFDIYIASTTVVSCCMQQLEEYE